VLLATSSLTHRKFHFHIEGSIETLLGVLFRRQLKLLSAHHALSNALILQNLCLKMPSTAKSLRIKHVSSFLNKVTRI
jgi:hypothetical protein